ncbi:hypothetical protein QWZ16_20370 [Vibrio ostreicida]|uniref:Uncharacterized protein n=1 Tax=Vibrio ostreicida TaxID=526588 RepID=A0ABT8C0S2_9VIBR|nr:hypothetical protein [Vibrio ostreicida]MDN3611950.1 hypothetical protein [Vibrio ostreicida]
MRATIDEAVELVYFTMACERDGTGLRVNAHPAGAVLSLNHSSFTTNVRSTLSPILL